MSNSSLLLLRCRHFILIARWNFWKARRLRQRPTPNWIHYSESSNICVILQNPFPGARASGGTMKRVGLLLKIGGWLTQCTAHARSIYLARDMRWSPVWIWRTIPLATERKRCTRLMLTVMGCCCCDQTSHYKPERKLPSRKCHCTPLWDAKGRRNDVPQASGCLLTNFGATTNALIGTETKRVPRK